MQAAGSRPEKHPPPSAVAAGFLFRMNTGTGGLACTPRCTPGVKTTELQGCSSPIGTRTADWSGRAGSRSKLLYRPGYLPDRQAVGGPQNPAQHLSECFLIRPTRPEGCPSARRRGAKRCRSAVPRTTSAPRCGSQGALPVPASVRQRGLTPRYVATGVPAIGLVVASRRHRAGLPARRGFGRPSTGRFGQDVLRGDPNTTPAPRGESRSQVTRPPHAGRSAG